MYFFLIVSYFRRSSWVGFICPSGWTTWKNFRTSTEIWYYRTCERWAEYECTCVYVTCSSLLVCWKVIRTILQSAFCALKSLEYLDNEDHLFKSSNNNNNHSSVYTITECTCKLLSFSQSHVLLLLLLKVNHLHGKLYSTHLKDDAGLLWELEAKLSW